MKNVLYKGSSVFINLIEGAVAVLAFAMSYGFIFEKYNTNHDSGLGVFVLLVWMLVLLMPNLFFILDGKFSKKENLYFQLVPFILGSGIFIVFKLFLY